MRLVTKAIGAVAIAAGLTASGAAQPPDGGRKKDGPPSTGGFGAGQARGPGATGGPEQADPQLEAWVKTLTDKMNDPHDAIRDSARAALVAVGAPALSALRPLAAGNDAKAFTARRLVQQIERGPGMPIPAVGGFGGSGFGGPRDPRANPTPIPDGSRPVGDPTPARPGPGRDTPPPGAGRDPAPGAAREAGGQPLARILGELGLTDPQRGQVERVIEGYGTKMRDVFDKARSGQLDRAALRDTLTKMADDATADLKRVLTPDQLRRFDELAPPGRSIFPTPLVPAEAGPGRTDPTAPDRPRQPRPTAPGGGR
ncbi:MAG TPA: hypothetical protein VH092_29530 [Urbifossiella sp.]|nr:hypothetical protein [Urbifossiella sp.]